MPLWNSFSFLNHLVTQYGSSIEEKQFGTSNKNVHQCFPNLQQPPCSLYQQRFHACLLLVLCRPGLMLCTVLIWFNHYSPKALIPNLWLVPWSRTANMLNYLDCSCSSKPSFWKEKMHRDYFTISAVNLHQYFMPTAGGFTLCNLCWGLTPPPFFVHELQRDHYLHKFVYCPKLSYE